MISDPEAPVTVLVVDDSADIRMMLRLLLDRDERFRVVGEGANGEQAVDQARLLHPDLVILDRQMPVLGGIEAIPRIRQAAPGTDIVLYTAGAARDSEALALSAGAIGMLEKGAMALSVVEDLASLLVSRWGDEAAEVEIRLGPVPAAAARVWIQNTGRILEAVHDHPEVLGSPVPELLYRRFRAFLDTWAGVAEQTDTFFWIGRARPEEARALVEEWTRVDSMGDEKLAALGCSWSPAEGITFRDALNRAILSGLERHEGTRRLAQRLAGRGWAGRNRATESEPGAQG